jgi:hypothetical protein
MSARRKRRTKETSRTTEKYIRKRRTKKNSGTYPDVTRWPGKP